MLDLLGLWFGFFCDGVLFNRYGIPLASFAVTMMSKTML